MLVTLADMKTYLGITGSGYDTFLTEQITLISEVIEAYCRRRFAETDYEQTFYKGDYPVVSTLETFHFPVTALTSVTADSVLVDAADYRVHKPSGSVIRTSGYFFQEDETVVLYTAGYAIIPTPVTSVVYSVVQERYNKKTSGIDLNFGSDVQSISIPGAISIAFDYSLNNNERKNSFGAILGSNLNVLDAYRSDRAILGSSKLIYVEDV